ncbi:hypothetical protein HID58_095656 [Brassica napus]|uniref:Uncharacterized protein n=1 Tax=Brassica napus TaxID=3708 RepID=A0ABQ7X5G0_BRANA|nr:hypothetical protein HID58_095656 [Brassica napus]
MVRLTIWDNEAANFRELNRISTRKNQIENYHSRPHHDRTFTLTPTLISYNASKRRINCYPKPDSKRHHSILKNTLFSYEI